MAHSSGAHLEAALLLVTVRGPRPAGIELRLNGDPVAAELLDRGAIAVAPGRHRFDLSAPGKRPVARDVSGGAGEKRVAVVSFDDELMASTDEPAGGPASSQKAWGLALGVVGVAGVVLGSVVGAIAASDKSSLQREADEASIGATRFYADRSTADTYASISTVAFIAGGAVLATGIGLYLTGPTPSRHHVRASLSSGPGGTAAAFITGTF